MTNTAEYQKTWRAKNATHVRAYRKTYIATHPEYRQKARERAGRWAREHPERIKEKARMSPKQDPVIQRNAHLKCLYGITTPEYEAMLEKQGGVCVICGRPPKTLRLHVDHCHKTKAVRGLLCLRCNMMCGHLHDSPALFRRAADYLEYKLSP